MIQGKVKEFFFYILPGVVGKMASLLVETSSATADPFFFLSRKFFNLELMIELEPEAFFLLQSFGWLPWGGKSTVLFSFHISSVFVAAINGGMVLEEDEDVFVVIEGNNDDDVGGGGTVTIVGLVAAADSSLNFGRTRTSRFRFCPTELSVSEAGSK